MNKNSHFRQYFGKISGKSENLPLELRSINTFCFVCVFSFYAAVLISLMLKAPIEFTMAYLIFALLYNLFYILARRFRLYKLVVGAMITATCFYTAFLWFYDGGISGPANIISLLAIILVSPLPDKTLRRLSISAIIIVQGVFYGIQFFAPDRVVALQSLDNQFAGGYLSYVFVAIITAALVQYILKNLRVEREAADKARKRLKESEYLFRILSETTSTAIVLCQEEKFAYANPAAQKLYGYSLDELKIRRFQHLVAPEDQEKIQINLTPENSGQKSISGDEIRILPQSGSEIPVYIEASNTDYYGKPALLISMINLTRLREAETHLFNLQNYLSDIINSMPSILVGVDENLKVTQWNNQAYNRTGILIDQAVGKSIFSLIPWLSPESTLIMKAVADRQTMENIRVTVEMKGQTRIEEITIYPLKESETKGAVIRLDDVTEKIRIEEMIVQSEKMLSVGELAAGMAHEINNPLAGILQNVQLAKNRLSPDLDANVHAAENAGTTMSVIRDYMKERRIFDQLENINTAGIKAAKIVENMLSFAKKGTPKQPHDMAQILLRAFELAGSDYTLKKEFDFNRITLQTEFNPSVSQVNCEENKITQVLLNIFSNAAQAIADAEPQILDPLLIIRLDAESHPASEDKGTENRMLRIEIEDNGPGMTENVRKRVFEPFFTTKDVNKGTGLGLSLSYFIIVKDHDGEIEVDSAPGKGANFIIRLPLN